MTKRIRSDDLEIIISKTVCDVETKYLNEQRQASKDGTGEFSMAKPFANINYLSMMQDIHMLTMRRIKHYLHATYPDKDNIFNYPNYKAIVNKAIKL